MNTHEEKFCTEVINDDSQEGYNYHEMVGEMLHNSNYDIDDRVSFVKRVKSGEYSTDQLNGIIYEIIDGDYEECAQLLDIDLDYASEIESNRSKWEGTDCESDFEEKLEELNASDDDDEDEDEDEDW